MPLNYQIQVTHGEFTVYLKKQIIRGNFTATWSPTLGHQITDNAEEDIMETVLHKLSN